MALTSTIQSTLSRYQQEIYTALHTSVKKHITVQTQPFYGQMQYHLGWVDTDFQPMNSNPGKYLRPTLLILAFEAAGAWGLAEEAPDTYLQRVLPAAVSVELTHNFSLIHDDIEDGDIERRHRATIWKQWGIPQAINTGDGMFALARLSLWDCLDKGVESDIAARLGELLDRACLILAEGQFLDISFEQSQDISVAQYTDMISRKTGALMGCAAEMGARLGTRNQETIDRLLRFGQVMGVAFQMRDDILGVWASTVESGKTPAGDIYRRKRSLPILHALEYTHTSDQQVLHKIYQQEATPSAEQVAEILTIFERSQTRAYCSQFLIQQCQQAYEALANVPRHTSLISSRVLKDMEMLVHFVEETAKATSN